MGDMADWINDNSELDYLYEDRQKVCKFCGKGGLWWSQVEDKKWRLFGEDGLHTCKDYRVNDEQEG